MRYAGIHWPNGPEPAELWMMPGTTYLLLDSEARWHYDDLQEKRPEALLLWRSIAVPPVSVKMSAKRYCDAVLRHWDQQQGQTDLIPGNEWNLNYERGDNQDDWNRDVMEDVYQNYGTTFAAKVRQELRGRVAPGVRLHYPAWAPDHYLTDFVSSWRYEAEQWDVVDFHAYGALADIQRWYGFYRAIFPTKRLCLTEWHGRDRNDVQEEQRILTWLAGVCQRDPLFMGATFFIWKWHGEGRPTDWNIEGNPPRLALFARPPVADAPPVAEPSPAPPLPEPDPIPSTNGARIMTIRDLKEIRWRAHVPGLPYFEDAAFAVYWREHPEIGSPLTGELPLDDGRVGQVFTNAELGWSADKGVEVL